MKASRFPHLYLTTGTLLAGLQLVHAAGFQLNERSTAGLGRAFSGEAAIADDASAIASNPASLTWLPDTAYSLGFSYIAPDVTIDGTSNFGPAHDDGPGQAELVPYAYISHKLNDD